MMIGATPGPPPEESSFELAGLTAVVFVLPDFASPAFLWGVVPVDAGVVLVEVEVVVAEVPEVPLEPPAPADLSPVADGTLGRYSCPDGAAATDAAITAAVAAARQIPANVLLVVVKASGGRRY
jgi:hypothetical protein